MVTELQFLVDLLLVPRTKKDLAKHIATRIGEVEESLRGKPRQLLTQAPSTQALMEAQTTPMPPVIPKRVVGGELDNGDGTKGKRKW